VFGITPISKRTVQYWPERIFAIERQSAAQGKIFAGEGLLYFHRF
jgi:hypothetical protein